MKLEPVIKAILGKLDKIRNRFGCIFFEKLHGQCAVVGNDFSLHGTKVMLASETFSVLFFETAESPGAGAS